jgi:hypothetical protein
MFQKTMGIRWSHWRGLSHRISRWQWCAGSSNSVPPVRRNIIILEPQREDWVKLTVTESRKKFMVFMQQGNDITNFVATMAQSVLWLEYVLDNWGTVIQLPVAGRNLFLFHRIQTSIETHPTLLSSGYWGSFPRGKGASTWSLQLTSI